MSRYTHENRLKKKEDINLLFDKGMKIRNNFFTVRFRANQLPLSRLAIIITKSIVKQAVKRNALRRVVRESFRNHQPLMKGLDILVVLRSECIPLNRKCLREKIETLWPRLIHT